MYILTINNSKQCSSGVLELKQSHRHLTVFQGRAQDWKEVQIQTKIKYFQTYGRKSLRNIGICLGYPAVTGKGYPMLKKITLA